MKIYRVDEHHVLHRCPADPELHVIDIRRAIVHVTDTGPCLTPVTIGHDTAVTSTIPCSRHEPNDRQCDNCRTVITTGRITTSTRPHIARPDTARPDTARTDIEQVRTATSGLAQDPCSVCGNPLAAVLADYGQHINGRYLGCHPRQPARPLRDAA